MIWTAQLICYWHGYFSFYQDWFCVCCQNESIEQKGWWGGWLGGRVTGEKGWRWHIPWSLVRLWCPRSRRMERTHCSWARPAWAKAVLYLDLVLEAGQRCVSHYATSDFCIGEYNYPAQPSDHCKNITCLLHTFFSFQLALQCPPRALPTVGLA